MKKEYLNEIWKPIKGYEGLYEVSNFGRIKSLNYHRMGFEKIISASFDGSGYLVVVLCKNNTAIQYKVHRLVAEAFIQNPNNLPEINHKDENKTNNIYTNLEWCDRSYNVNYGTRNKRASISISKSLLNNEKICKPILQLSKEGVIIKEWLSAAEAEREGGYDNAHISKCCLGQRKTHKGFIWRFK